jgi:hypothetical protein
MVMPGIAEFSKKVAGGQWPVASEGSIADVAKRV